MWKRYFKFIKLKPGKVVTAQFGEIDFSADTIGIEIIQALYENGFPYLEITEQGKAELYGAESTRKKAARSKNQSGLKNQANFFNLD